MHHRRVNNISSLLPSTSNLATFNPMILGVAMKFIQTLTGITILLCPSSHAFQLAPPSARVPLGLHMTLSPVHALNLHRNKGLKVTHSPIRRRNTRRKMSDVSEAQESDDGFWNKVRFIGSSLGILHSFLTTITCFPLDQDGNTTRK